MKNYLFYLTVIFMTFISCSETDVPEIDEQPIEIKTVEITSYSKNFAYTGDEVVIEGENFPAKDKCKIYFDDVPVEIINVTPIQIRIRIPESSKAIPTLTFKFGDERNTIHYENNVENNYSGNIAIINKKIGSWVSTTTSIFEPDDDDLGFQIQDNGQLYFNVEQSGSGRVLSSSDDGITWQLWKEAGFISDFYATKNGEGWVTGWGVEKVIVGLPPHRVNTIFKHPDRKNAPFSCVYVEDDMKTGIAVSTSGDVFKTTDGESFKKLYSYGSQNLDVQKTPFKLDINHIWAIGFDYTLEMGLIIFCNGDNESWYHYLFSEYPRSMVNNIYFVNGNVGYCSLYTFGNNLPVKLFKTTDGGANWNLINNDIPNLNWRLSMVFLDENTGYVSSNNKIYITKDGGNSWALDFTADTNIRKLGYGNDRVYAISSNNIHRKFLK